MAVELGALFAGRLVFRAPAEALDDVRFERILAGFSEHYEVEALSPDSFSFARGEGLPRFERLDAFAYVDRGTVSRLRARGKAGGPADGPSDGKVVPLAPVWSGLAFDLHMRVAFAFLAFAMIAGWLLAGGDPFLWGAGYVGAAALTVALVQFSIARKLRRWLARESWN